MDKARIAALPAEMRKYVIPLRREYDAVLAAQAAARPGHVRDCLEFAGRAWRRPLTEQEKQSLRSFYDKTISADPDHPKAIQGAAGPHPDRAAVPLPRGASVERAAGQTGRGLAAD